MELSIAEAEQLALDFLMTEWDINSEDQEWFSVLNTRQTGENWYIVEIGVEGLPDKWFIQVYDTRECDPNYTFNSPMNVADFFSDINELPDRISHVIAAERSAGVV
ncbi:MAG TPA: hypothetical protein V6C78_25360 [Crinalium sp.]|jgi:hypothetical protein